jgi:hypothetical protein
MSGRSDQPFSMEAVRNAPAAGAADALDLEILRRYFDRQFRVLIRRHAAQDAILLRVVADHCQQPVCLANQGCLDEARRALSALDGLVTTEDAELVAVHRVAALPARALIHFREHDHAGALALLEQALDACLELTVRFGHDYLTPRRLHLAANTARVFLAQGLTAQALERGAALHAVAGGERAAWPLAGGDSLEVPLQGPERFGIDYQLERIVLLCSDTRRA